MSGIPPVKRVRFADSHGHAEVGTVEGDAGTGGRHQAGASTRRAVDSDEEELHEEPGDEAVGDSGKLTDDNIEGQEEATIANDNGIAITPFNLREEMEEGYFDSAGCYIFKRDDREIHDNWLDNVDWDTVAYHQRPAQQRQGAAAAAAASTVEGNADHNDGSSDDGEGELSPSELANVCTAARGLLGPGETVAAAIKRLGGGANRALTASQRLRLKKLGGGGNSAGAATGAEAAAAAAANRSRMLELSELAGRLVSAGHMAAYQMDARQLTRLGGVGDAEAAKASAPPGSAGMDMFASDEEDHAEEENAATSEKSDKDQQVENKESTGVEVEAEAGGVFWFYRVADSDTAEVLGPYSSRCMLEWSESEAGWPPGGHRQVFVRKAEAPPDAPFYSSARIDFDLYV